jgi:hypothetical protein
MGLSFGLGPAADKGRRSRSSGRRSTAGEALSAMREFRGDRLDGDQVVIATKFGFAPFSGYTRTLNAVRVIDLGTSR